MPPHIDFLRGKEIVVEKLGPLHSAGLVMASVDSPRNLGELTRAMRVLAYPMLDDPTPIGGGHGRRGLWL